MKKATIKNVVMQILGEWYVTYESGAHRTYAEDKLPKTARKWLEEHPENQKAADEGKKYWNDIDVRLSFLEDLKGKGRGCGRAYEAQLKKYGKQTVIWMAENAGMSIKSNTTKKEALAYLLGTEQMTSNENYAA